MPFHLLKFALSKKYPEPRMFKSPEKNCADSYDAVIIGRRGARAGRRLLPGQCAWHHQRLPSSKSITSAMAAPAATRRSCESNYLTEEGARFYQFSVDLFRDLSRTLNYNIFYSQRGHFTIAHSSASLRTQRWRAEVNKHLGIDSEVVGPEFIRKTIPEIDLACGGHQPPIVGALYQPPGSIVRHDAVAWAYARGGRSEGC